MAIKRKTTRKKRKTRKKMNLPIGTVQKGKSFRIVSGSMTRPIVGTRSFKTRKAAKNAGLKKRTLILKRRRKK